VLQVSGFKLLNNDMNVQECDATKAKQKHFTMAQRDYNIQTKKAACAAW